MQQPAWWKTDDAMALHFLLQLTEGEHLNMPVGWMTPRVVFIRLLFHAAMGGRQGRALNRADT